MPVVQKNPVHLEITVQIDGKTILFFFMNQQSFNALTDGDSMLRPFSMNFFYLNQCLIICIFQFSSVKPHYQAVAHR